LDEPVNGLDPNGMMEIRELLVKLNREKGTTIFISSHLLQEIDKMVTHLGIISHGEMKFEGSREELNQMFQFQKTKFSMNDAEKYLPYVENAELKNNRELLVNTNSSADVAKINKTLIEKGAEIYQISAVGGLEEWFMEITKQN
jgi:ABC-2 type transport system ATP-binding protein